MLHLIARRGMLLRSIVLALLKRRPMAGIEVIREIERMSMGLWRPSPGTIYPLLKLLEKEGLVKSKEVGGMRIYELTDRGEAVAGELALLLPPESPEEVLDSIEAYINYLRDYSNEKRLGEKARERVKALAEMLRKLGEEE
ncbi:MAG: PadR family transcriptional regulator [Thermoprotei archaeon]|nr:MAG: PadR family transcriptional regulator [Thermoprotei archaeon]RLE98646.1 MAG: PadR family transcriptional regulator [Thermoprotei archaeon]